MLFFFPFVCLLDIFDVLMEGLHDRSQRLLLFPDQHCSRLHGRRKGQKPKIIKGQVQVEAQRRSHTAAHHIGGVENQVEGGGDLQVIPTIPKPTGQLPLYALPSADQQRFRFQILRRDCVPCLLYTSDAADEL